MLKVKHNYGFFSCSSVRLYKIITYLNRHKTIPTLVDSSESYNKYKADCDVTTEMYEDYTTMDIPITFNTPIPIDRFNFQFSNYKDIDYASMLPFITKYFTPSKQIIAIRDALIDTYKIDPDTCVGLYYRGTDKRSETHIGDVNQYLSKINGVMEPGMTLFAQTDSTQCLNFFKTHFPSLIHLDETTTSSTNRGIHYQKTAAENNIEIKYLFASLLILAKCKYVVCSSGNCSIWLMHYRGGANNVQQYLNDIWY